MAACVQLLWFGWCGECYANRRGRSQRCGHWGCYGRKPPRRINVGQFCQRVVPGSSVAGPGVAAGPDAFAKSYPALAEYLTLATWEDGTVRETSTLYLFVDEGVTKGCLNDREAGRVAFVAGDGVAAVLKSMEKGLVANTLDWRPDRKAKGKRKV